MGHGGAAENGCPNAGEELRRILGGDRKTAGTGFTSKRRWERGERLFFDLPLPAAVTAVASLGRCLRTWPSSHCHGSGWHQSRLSPSEVVRAVGVMG